MNIDIEFKSKELKKFISKYDTNIFLGDLRSLMDYISSDPPMPSLRNLKSPLRQLYYLASLHLTSSKKEENEIIAQYSDEDWDHIVNLLNEIELGYDQLLLPDNLEELSKEEAKKYIVTIPTFLSFFNQGALNYQEQIIERIEKQFIPFDGTIRDKFGLEVNDFLSFYFAIDTLIHIKINKVIPKEDNQSWESFVNEMCDKKIMLPDWNDYLPEHIKYFFESMYDKGIVRRIEKKELLQQFSEEQINLFLDLFSLERKGTNFLYFSEKNPLHKKPIFKTESKEYQVFETKQILYSIYDLLNEYCKNDAKIKDRYLKNQKELVELKIIEIFRPFLLKDYKIHHNYYLDEKEQDILILHKGIALIIEVKAYKKREPQRDPSKAFRKIKDDFQREIGYGYKQAFRVKERFLDNDTFEIKSKKGEVIDTIRGKNYFSAYCIIVTLERYGQIQIDLSNLLDIYEDDEYPYSICVDDLEVFILAMLKKGKNFKNFIQFLYMRQFLHGHIYSNDELQICGAYLGKKLSLKECRSKAPIFTNPEMDLIFDDLYEKGLGFKNEINLEKKKSGKYLAMG